MRVPVSFYRLWRDSRGSAAVETVLVAPLAILLSVTAMEAGFYLYTEHQVVIGVRDAARYAARLDMVSTWACNAAKETQTIVSGTAADQIKNVARFGNASGTGPARPWTWDANEVEVAVRCEKNVDDIKGIYLDHSAGQYAPIITITGKPNYPSLFGTLGGFDTSLHLFATQEAAGAGV